MFYLIEKIPISYLLNASVILVFLTTNLMFVLQNKLTFSMYLCILTNLISFLILIYVFLKHEFEVKQKQYKELRNYAFKLYNTSYNKISQIETEQVNVNTNKISELNSKFVNLIDEIEKIKLEINSFNLNNEQKTQKDLLKID